MLNYETQTGNLYQKKKKKDTSWDVINLLMSLINRKKIQLVFHLIYVTFNLATYGWFYIIIHDQNKK